MPLKFTLLVFLTIGLAQISTAQPGDHFDYPNNQILAELELLLKKNPNDTLSLARKAVIIQSKENALRVISRDRENGGLFSLILSKEYLRLNKPDSAWYYAEMNVAHGAMYTDIWPLRLRASSGVSEELYAEEIERQIRNHYFGPEPYYAKGFLLLKREQLDSAIFYYNQGLFRQTEGRFYDALYWAEALAENHKDKAIEVGDALLTYSSTMDFYAQFQQAYFFLDKIKDYPKALEMFKADILKNEYNSVSRSRVNGSNHLSLFGQGLCKYHLGDEKAGLTDMFEAAMWCTEEIDLKGLGQWEEIKDPRMDIISCIVTINKMHFTDTTGDIWKQQKIKLLSKYVNDFPILHYYVGMLQFRLGNKKDAKKSFDKGDIHCAIRPYFRTSWQRKMEG